MLVAVSDRPGWMVAPTRAMVGLRCCWHASDSSSCMASPCACMTVTCLVVHGTAVLLLLLALQGVLKMNRSMYAVLQL